MISKTIFNYSPYNNIAISKRLGRTEKDSIHKHPGWKKEKKYQ